MTPKDYDLLPDARKVERDDTVVQTREGLLHSLSRYIIQLKSLVDVSTEKTSDKAEDEYCREISRCTQLLDSDRDWERRNEASVR